MSRLGRSKSSARLGMISSVNDSLILESIEPITSSTISTDLLKGELLLLEISDIVLFNSKSNIELESGNLYVTNFQMIFTFPERNTSSEYKTSITHSSILKLDKSNLDIYEIYSISSKDLNNVEIGVPLAEKKRKDLLKILTKYTFPKSKKTLFCYNQTQTYQNDGWALFKLESEFNRFGVSDQWKICQFNTKHDISPKYPSLFIVPNSISEDDLYGILSFRYDGKIPLLTWGSSTKYLIRCGCASMQSTDEVTGIASSASSIEDEKFFKAAIQHSGKEKLTFYECTKIEAEYSKFYNERCKFFNLYLPFDNQMQEYLRGLISLCSGYQNSVMLSNSQRESGEAYNEHKKWMEEIHQSKWIDNIHKMLAHSLLISRKVNELGETSVLVDSHNNNCIVVISGVIQLLLDPFYRTIKGYMILIEKEFLYFGHKFGSFKKRDEDGYSSIFLCFLDCTWQLLHQFPFSFEFEESLLLFIIDSVYSCQFGTFLCSTEKERVSSKITSTPSIWSEILENNSVFLNPLFSPTDAILPFTPNRENIRLWNTFYLRHKFKFNLLKVCKRLSTIRKKDYAKGDFSSLDLPFLPIQPWKNFDYLSELILSTNNLVKFPTEITFLVHLKRIILDNNHISFISDDLLRLCTEKLKDLVELNLNNNEIYIIQPSITNFLSLQILSLNSNKLKTIPDISSYTQLHTLDIGNNPFEPIPSQHISIPTLTSISVASSGIPELPGIIFQCNTVLNLNISGNNKIEALPDQFSTLTSLELLNLSHLNLKTFPECIFTFTLLKELNLSSMRLNSLSESIVNLVHLEWFSLSHNNFSVFPNEILSLVNLRHLFLNNNQLENIPLDISMLSQLIELHLQNNKLTCLSPGIGNLTLLIYLNVSSNQIRHLPATIGYLSYLKSSKNFYFENNPKLITPPPEIIRSGFDSVFNFLQSLLEGSKKCYRMKIMVVGQENVGKSSLLRCLIAHNNAKKVKKQKAIHVDKSLVSTGLDSMSTDGIDISKMSFFSKFYEPGVPPEQVKKTKVELSLWDFAGQEIYYTTHQFFLSERAVYLLVWNMSKAEEDSRVEYWLKSIYARAKDASIIIVATHMDHPKCTKEYVMDTLLALQNKYLRQFPSIKQIIPVSCSSNLNIDEVNLWIQEIVRNQTHMGEMIPTSYLELEKLVRDESSIRVPPVVNWEQFKAMGTICNIKPDKLLTATSLLNDFGSLVYFQKHKGLEDVVILDPQWLTDVMSTIITTKHTYVRSGVLEHKNLPMIWRAPNFPPHLHKTLLNLLEKFEISYYLKSTQVNNDYYTGSSLVPAMLPEDRPSDLDQKWSRFPSQSEPQYSRHYKFNFIPHGFISRLLVRLLHFAEPTVFWRHGMLVEANDEQFGFYAILIEAQPARKEIGITIRGSSGAKLSQIVIETMNALIDGWHGLEPEIYIPCIHCIRQKMYDPFIFMMEECEKAAIAGKSIIKCRNTKAIRLDELVPDVAMTHVQNCKLSYEDLNIEKQIGEGGFALVYKGTYKDFVVAIKKIKFGESDEDSLSDVTEVQAFAEFRREVWIMSGLTQQNIVQLIGFTMDPFCIVTEFIYHGNLYDYIHDLDKPMSPSYQWRCAIDIAKGMNFLHTTSPPIIHRDLKSPNILISSLKDFDPVVVKVADFGLSQALASTTKGRSVANPIWLAPEIMRNEEYSEKADVYSFAVICWEIFTREEFFGTVGFLSVIEGKVLDGLRPEIPDHVPAEIREIIELSWNQQADDRPSFTTILSMLKSAMTQYFPELCDTAFYEPEEVVVVRPVVNITETTKRSKEEIEEEQREFELAKKEQSKKEMEKICSRITDFNSSIMCMEVVNGSVWVGTKEGNIMVYNQNKQLTTTISVGSSTISLLLAGDSVWCSCADSSIKIIPLKTPYKVKKEIKGSPVFSLKSFGKFVIAGSEQLVSIYTAKSFKLKKKFKVEGVCALSVHLDENHQILWVGTDNNSKSIIRFNFVKGKLIDSHSGHSGNVTGMIEISEFIWTCSSDKTIRIWTLDTADCIKIITGHTGPIYSIKQAGQHVWSVSWDKSVILWDAMYQMFYKEYEAHSDSVNCLAAISNNLIWTGSSDKTIVCWNGPF